MSAYEDAVTSLVNGGYSPRIAREILAAVLGEAQSADRRALAARIRQVGTAKGWSTWAAAYIDPDVEFVDTAMPSTETIVAELRRLDRAAVLREVEVEIAAAVDRNRAEYPDEPAMRARRLGMRAAGQIVHGLREGTEGREKDTSGGPQPSAGESTPAPLAEPYSYTDAHNHRLTLLSTTDVTGRPYVWLKAGNLAHGGAEVSVWLRPLAAQNLDRHLAAGVAYENTDHTGDQVIVRPSSEWTVFEFTGCSGGDETPDRVRVVILTARLPDVRDGLRAAMRQAEEKAARRVPPSDTGKTSHDGHDSQETQ